MSIKNKIITIVLLFIVFVGLLTYNILNPYEEDTRRHLSSSESSAINEYSEEVDSILEEGESGSDFKDYSSEESAPSDYHALEDLSIEDKWQVKYLGNQLSNGAQPYRSLYGKNKQSGTSEIIVTAPTDRDALVMVKNGSDRVIRHAYIKSGMRYTFHISAGYHQVYFICGKDWCPEKEAPNGQMGYFLHSSVSKDSQTYIDDYQSLTYTLQSMANGNFMPQNASSYEAF